MQRKTAIWINISLVLCLSICMEVGNAQSMRLPKEATLMTKKKLAKGLKLFIWKSNTLFDSQQSLSVLEIKKGRKVSIAYEKQALKPTSQFGMEAKALAAVNAGFFDMRKGGSVTYLEVGQEVIAKNSSKNSVITTAALAITEKGRLRILAKPDSTTLQKDDWRGILYTGPLLLQNGQESDLPDNNFSNRRHPRTCACTRKNGQALLVAVDGRNAQAQGMSLPELTTLLKMLRCDRAINLDGGGSTTMWVKGIGVVSHPSDNKKFDAAGERVVANAILVH
ncbi:MAG: phosphodiester glycosidase family protein [Saprospiraceae bacterium]|nr:phosphodiester glycosidase family protein [Saprospiraceae bacterium]